jgi:hypothetical protein
MEVWCCVCCVVNPCHPEVASVDSLDESGFDMVVKTCVVVICQLACVGTFVEAAGQGGVVCGGLNRCAVGKLSGGSGCEGDDGSGLIMEGKLSCPAFAYNPDSPKAIFGVAQPLQDDLAVECDFTTCFVKKYLAALIAQDGGREEIVDEARELMCKACTRK